jgi:lipoyl(octanoyl) transferase
MIEWKTSKQLVPYDHAIETMQQRVLDIRNQTKNELIWLLEHPHVFTKGTSSKEEHLLNPNLLPIINTGRGGSYTYHGPGQRIVYVMLDLRKQKKDIRKFVWDLEHWLISTFKLLGVIGERRPNRIGIWVVKKDSGVINLHSSQEKKIASIGLRIKNWVSYYGVSINLNPNLTYFDGIIPCGNSGYGVTSLREQGLKTSLTDLDNTLKQTFGTTFEVFG